MKKISFFLAAALLVCTAASIQSCQSTSKTATSKMFRFNLEQGKGYDYELVWDIDSKVAEQQSSVSMTALYTMNVMSVEDGIRSVETAYKAMRMNIKAAGMNFNLDTDKPIDNGDSDAAKNPLGMMNRALSGIVNKKFVVKVNEEGKVLEVTGFEKIISDVIDSMGMEESMKAQVAASMKDQFSEQNIKDQFAQVFYIFPNKEVKVGDSWDKQYSTGGKMGGNFTTTYTVKEIEGDHVTLTARTKITSKEGGQSMDGTQTGNVIVDSKTGLMINASFDQDITVTTSGQKVSVIGKGKIKGTAR